MKLSYLIIVTVAVSIFIIYKCNNKKICKVEDFKIESSYPYLSTDYSIFLTPNVLLCNNHSLEIKDSSIPIIFVDAEILTENIDKLLELKNNYNLITTSNNDICMPYVSYPCPDDIKIKYDRLLNHDRLNKWYTKNPSIVHNKLIPLPIGPKMQWSNTSFFGEPKAKILSIYNKNFLEPEILFKDTSLKNNLLYININPGTTDNPYYKEHKNIRRKALTDLKNKGFKSSSNKSIEDYIVELKTYKFCLSPPGNGIDTHRTWESLLVGTIPICITSPLDSIMTDLPVLIVDDYSVINDAYLEEQYKKIHDRDYDFSSLYCDYWKNRIRNLE